MKPHKIGRMGGKVEFTVELYGFWLGLVWFGGVLREFDGGFGGFFEIS